MSRSRSLSSRSSSSGSLPGGVVKLVGIDSEKGASKFEEEDPQDTDIEDSIASLEANDPSLTELNLNNHSKLDSNLIDDLIQALSENTQLETLQMTNVKFTDDHAEAIGRVLKTNTTLKVVNLESNRLTPKGIKFVMRGIAENPETSLKELRLANQYFAGGARAESEIAKYLEKIKTITKLGYNFAVPSYRTKVDAYIMRNTDYIRKKRASLVV